MRHDVKLQINSKEALERLIGGDSQLEIELRNSIVQEFAEKYLKAVANSEVIDSKLEKLKNGLIEQFNSECEKKNWYI